MKHGDLLKTKDGSASAAERLGFALTALALLTGIALTVSLATAAYRAILRAQAEDDARRGSLSYVRTQVKSHDYEDGVALRDGMLVLVESAGEARYELRIYAREGWLMEEYCVAGEASAPERASRLTETERFAARRIDEDLLLIETDGGESYIRLFAASLAEGAA